MPSIKACLLRFRPILMTTVAAIFGALPLMFGTGTGSELRHPLGISIVGGLLVSQVLTLFTTPVIYLAFDRLAARLRGRRQAEAGDARRRLADSPDMNISAPFIRRPVATILLTIGRRAVRRRGLHAAAGGAAAAHRRAGDLRLRAAAGRESRGHGEHASRPRWSGTWAPSPTSTT